MVNAISHNLIERLFGTWRLVSVSSTTSKGEPNDSPYGLDPVGFLTYGTDGRVTALISYGGRKPLSVGASTEEQAEAFKTFLAYTGQFRLVDDKVHHHIEMSSIQNYVGRDLVRSVRFEGDRIVLVTPPTSVSGKLQTLELLWERLTVAP